MMLEGEFPMWMWLTWAGGLTAIAALARWVIGGANG